MAALDPIERARSRPRHTTSRLSQNLSITIPSNDTGYYNDVDRSSYVDEYVPGPLDVDACRDFIVFELGEQERLPNREAYAQGIQEARSRLISRYGDERIGQAMRIMYDLIENKDNAHGVGDFGDIWAPWRHDHNHRHEDFSSPGTPRFPNLILPDSRRWSEIVSVTKLSQALASEQSNASSSDADAPAPTRQIRKPLLSTTRGPLPPTPPTYHKAYFPSGNWMATTTESGLIGRRAGLARSKTLSRKEDVNASGTSDRPSKEKGKGKFLEPYSFHSRPYCPHCPHCLGEKTGVDCSGSRPIRGSSMVAGAFKRLSHLRTSSGSKEVPCGRPESSDYKQGPNMLKKSLDMTFSRRGKNRENMPPKLPALKVPGAMKWDT